MSTQTPTAAWQSGWKTALRPNYARFLIAALVTVGLLFVWTSSPSLSSNVEASFIQPEDSSAPVTQAPISNDLQDQFEDSTTKPESPKLSNKLLPWDEAEALCAPHNMTPYPHRDHHRKVYDLFLVGTELDWTEIRLNELAPHVDYFVIMEAERTFTNHTKPLYFKKNWRHFEQFEDQILYHLLNDEAIMDAGAWDREHYQRNAMVTQVFPNLLGKKAPNMGDVIIVSDVDEIPRPETIELLRNCDFPERVGIQSKFFLYSFQLHRTDGEWYHPQATYWRGNETILPESLRMTQVAYEFKNAAWHCTTCFSSLAEFVAKINAFSHQEWNRAEFKDPDQIVRRVRTGVDLFDRGFPYEKVPENEMDVPSYLLKHRQKFAYLLDREPANANFRDYVPPMTDDDSYDKSDELS